MINYYELGGAKKLNQIVMAGSHDAAITQGGRNARTQDLSIFHQAEAGVRIFDIRITGQIVKNSANANVVQLAAYHGSGRSSKHKLHNPTTGKMDAVKVKAMNVGTYGEALLTILSDAKWFVEKHATEFLILKFDKCDNWPSIAEACLRQLGERICLASGNLNERTLDDLKGQVIVVFSAKGLQAAGGAAKLNPQGIFSFENLADSGGDFSDKHRGIQYFGKGGTGLMDKPTFFKIRDNIKKQTELMQRGSKKSPKVMGMMYWTATGIFGTIRGRNDDLWSEGNQRKMIEMWAQRLPGHADMTSYPTSPDLKRFLPNFIMIDFADSARCKKIFELNFLAQHALTDKVRKFFDIAA